MERTRVPPFRQIAEGDFVVVDLSRRPPVGYGVYPGGQRGDPFSRHYDLHLPVYLDFEHFGLLKPASAEDLDPGQVSSRLMLVPSDGQ